MMYKKLAGGKFWGLVGKISVILGVVYVCIQIAEYLGRPGHSITARGDHFSWELPVPDDDEPSPLRILADVDSLDAFLSRIDSDDLRHDIKQAFLAYATRILQSPSVVNFRTIWHFVVENDGTKEARGLRLELPFDGYYCLIKPGEEAICSTYSKNIALGSLRSKNQIRVKVWSQMGSGPLWEKDTRVTHPEGVIAISYPVKVRGLLAWLDRHGPLLIIAVVSALLGLILYFGTLKLIGNIGGSKTAKSKEEAQDP